MQWVSNTRRVHCLHLPDWKVGQVTVLLCCLGNVCAFFGGCILLYVTVSSRDFICVCVCVYIYIYMSFLLVSKSKCPAECLTDLFSEHRKTGTLLCSVIRLTVMWLYPHCCVMQPPIYRRRLSWLVRSVTYPAVEYRAFTLWYFRKLCMCHGGILP